MSATAAEEHKELGNKAFSQKKFEEAIQHYSDAIKADKANHVYFSNRSASHAGLKMWKEAAQDAKECIRIDPSFMKGYYRLATAQLELENFDAAQATIKQGMVLDANNAQLLKLLRSIKQAKKAATNAAQQKEKPPLPGRMDTAMSKELQDLQMQYAQSSREYSTVQANLTKSQREQKMQQVTQDELKDYSGEGAFFRSIGKVFLKSNKDDVMGYLKTNVEEQTKKQSEMTQKLEYLEKRINSTRQNIQELASAAE